MKADRLKTDFPDPLLWSLEEAARQLSVSGRTVRRLVERGDLPYIKIGRSLRIRSTDVRAGGIGGGRTAGRWDYVLEDGARRNDPLSWATADGG